MTRGFDLGLVFQSMVVVVLVGLVVLVVVVEVLVVVVEVVFQSMPCEAAVTHTGQPVSSIRVNN